MSNSIIVEFKSLGADSSRLPQMMSEGAAGFDICAFVEQTETLKPMQRKMIPTGFAMAVPKGFECQVRPRSGLAIRHGITIINSPGTIDSDYRGEVKILMINLGEESFEINDGDRIAQLVFAPVVSPKLEVVTTLDETQRGAGGFGSTGAQIS